MTMTNKPYKAVLTGATGGIGRAIALQLAPQCSSLILMGRDTHKLEALKNELTSTAATAANIQIVSGDLCDDSTSVRLMDAISAQQGINLLINNAGISQFKSFEQQSDKDITQLMLTNLISPMLLCKQLLPLLKKESSQIINIGSIFGYLGFPGFSSYCASKFGLRGFSQSLRRELSDSSVSVRYFAPRATKTSINSDQVMQMNAELKTDADTPDSVAQEFMKFLSGHAWEKKLGFKESFFVFMNHLFPNIPDKAIKGQLPIINKYLNK
jgi:short-subunit dehydrogenase